MQTKKYKANLSVIGDNIYSYSTHVATINHETSEVLAHGWWSVTTSKHINYVANELNYKVIKNK